MYKPEEVLNTQTHTALLAVMLYVSVGGLNVTTVLNVIKS